jgi:hypothetical protein
VIIIPDEIDLPDDMVVPEEIIIPDETDKMALYSEALRRDPLIEVPKEPDDDCVQIVRNERRFTRRFPNGTPWAVPFSLEVWYPEKYGGNTLSVDEVEDNLDDEHGERDEEDDDDEHLKVLQALPPGLIISDETFAAEGLEGNTFVISCRNPQEVMAPDAMDAAVAQGREELHVAIAQAQEERRLGLAQSREGGHEREMESRNPIMRTGTFLVERYSGVTWQFITVGGDGTWVVVSLDGTVVRYFDPRDLAVSEE